MASFSSRVADASAIDNDNEARAEAKGTKMLDTMEDVDLDKWEAAASAAGTRQRKHVELDAEENDDEDEERIDAADNEVLLKAKKPRPTKLSLPSRPGVRRRTSNNSFYEEPRPKPPPKKAGPVSWRDLPHKRQLLILTMARLSEPLTQTSLQAYMYYQLESFDPSLSPSAISAQAGLLQGCFTGAQFLTAMLWGRAADADWGGRKRVLMMGLFGTCVSVLGFGFSRSFLQAALFRFAGGVLNGNVGVIRTMVSEVIKEKK